MPKNQGWSFDGNYERPTFTPSVKQTCYYDRGDVRTHHVDHWTITNGQVFFHPDSTHKASGQTFELDPLNEREITARFPEMADGEFMYDGND